MSKKLGDTDDFKPGKIDKANRIDDYRPGRRFSFRVPGDKPRPDTDCGDINIPDYRRNNTNVGRPDGYAVLYSGTQLENYRKQYPRFEAALNLIPDSKVDREGGGSTYLFCSKRSATGYWQVEVIPFARTYFINAGPPLQILCPVPFHVTQVQSDGESFTWTQLTGRSAFVDPANSIDPILHILDDVRSSEPIRFRIAVEADPTVNDELVIYTTPTSDYDGLSYDVVIAAPDADPNRRVSVLRPGAPLPQYLQRGYVVNPVGTYMFTWDLPAADVGFLTETIWQRNTTGAYLDVQRFPKVSDRIFTASLNTHYRILSVYNVYGNDSVIDSQRFYFTQGNRVVAADDSLDGLSYTGLRSQITSLPLGRVVRSVEDQLDGLSYTGLKGSVTSLPLSRKLLQPVADIMNGISFVGLKATIEKFNLGGVIIS